MFSPNLTSIYSTTRQNISPNLTRAIFKIQNVFSDDMCHQYVPSQISKSTPTHPPPSTPNFPYKPPIRVVLLLTPLKAIGNMSSAKSRSSKKREEKLKALRNGSLQDKLGIQFPLATVLAFLKEGKYAERVYVASSVYLTVVLESLTREVTFSHHQAFKPINSLFISFKNHHFLVIVMI